MDSSESPEEEFFDFGPHEICSYDEYDKEEAKERASILWLLSKASNGAIPSDLQEPFYRDHENQKKLKPKIIHSLANAELYCLALANIYSDPNYHNLNNHGIIQALTRKGICLHETREAPLTETVLIQTSPLRLNSHLSVIDGILSLYIKEVLIPEKIVDVVRGFSVVDLSCEMPSNSEESAVLWVNKCCRSLEEQIKATSGPNQPMEKLPIIPVLQDISDISDGCSLAAVITFYCPNSLRWQDVCWNDPMSLGDCIYNLQQIKQFCYQNLPHVADNLTLEDFLYVHPSIKDNIMVFVAELLYSFVIQPVKCVTRLMFRPANESTPVKVEGHKSRVSTHRSPEVPCSAIPNLRADSYGGSTSSLPELKAGGVIQSASQKEIPEKFTTRLSKERLFMFPQLQRTNSSGVVNGVKTTNASENSSRVNGASRLDSSDCEKSMGRVSKFSRMLSAGNRTAFSENEPACIGLEKYYKSLAAAEGPIRSGSLSNIRENRNWKSNPNERPINNSSTSSQSSGICISDADTKKLSQTSFSNFSKFIEPSKSSTNVLCMQQIETDAEKKMSKPNVSKPKHEKKTTFAALPNTTTWQQQRALSSNSSQADSGHETPVEPVDSSLNVQLTNIRMKLEDKRRRIETEKKRMESLWRRERQKLGKVVFLQAVSKGSGDAGTPDSGTGKEVAEELANASMTAATEKSFCLQTNSPSLVRRMSMQDIAEDLNTMQKKWLGQNEPTIEKHAHHVEDTDSSPDIGNPDNFQASIDQLNSSLYDLQADISRITIQQEHVENMMLDSVENVSQFFLHGKESLAKPNIESPVRNNVWDRSTNRFEVNTNAPQQPSFNSRSPVMRKKFNSSGMNEPNSSSFSSVKDGDINVEDLYSKIIKTESPRKTCQTKKQSSLPKEQNPDVGRDYFQSPSRTDHFMKQHQDSPKHVQISPKSPRYKTKPEQPETDKGFYISFNDQAKKATTKWQRVPPTVKKSPVPQPPDNEVDDPSSFGFVIGADLVHPDPETEIEMAKKRELIMHLSIKRRAEQESRKAANESEIARKREEEQKKRDYLERKKEDESLRRQKIFEQYRHRKMVEDLEKDGGKDISTKARTRTRARPKSAFVTGDYASTVDGNFMNKRNSHYLGASNEASEFDIDSLNSASTVSSRDRGRSPNSKHLSALDNNLRPPETYSRSSDNASDTTSNSSNAAIAPEYTGPKLFVKPTSKSNRGIIINAINTVLAGSVNTETKKKVLEEINNSFRKHFLILFRDAGFQFRALYSYDPDTEEIVKMYGIGPKKASEKIMERFFKYNSGGKCFSEIHTKHLTVTIDAFTMPNSIWTGKKGCPTRKDLF